MTPLRIFIGSDAREPIAWAVLAHSIMRRATIPVALIPLVQPALREAGIYTRERGPTESTDFAMTRFLVPYLSGYEGCSVFMDCDMLCRVDFAEVLRAVGSDPDHALWLCKHDYVPRPERKFLGLPQTVYPRKNWSSFVVFDNEKCKRLTPEYVNTASGLQLHRFLAFDQDGEIGALPVEWNHLVTEYPPNDAARILHWTRGGPWFSEMRHTEYADEWFAERNRMMGEPT